MLLLIISSIIITLAICRTFKKRQQKGFKMKRRSLQLTLPAIVLMLATSALPMNAAERLCSIYIESMSSLQSQIQQAALVFDAPELGMFPAMMTMLVPGGSQINMEEPISLHLFDFGDGNPGGVLELTPATTAEMFLKAMTAASGLSLDPPVDGRFTFNGGVAEQQGTRMRLARTAAELDACSGTAVPALPPMPALDGVIRIAMAPSAAVPALTQLKSELNASIPADPVDMKAFQNEMFDLYLRALAQINTLEMSLTIETDGIVVNKRLAAKAGSTVAEIIRSIQPVEPVFRNFITQDSLFSMASGRYRIPENLSRQMTRIYLNILKMSPHSKDFDEESFKEILQQSMEAAGAAMAFEIKLQDLKNIQIQGALGMQDAANYLQKMIAISQSPTYRKMTSESGIQVEGPTQRSSEGLNINTWRFALDEDALRKMIADQAPGTDVDPAAIEQINQAFQAFGSIYESAAIDSGLAFGMGNPAMVEQAARRLKAPSSDNAGDSIHKRLCPSATPAAIGRFDIVGLVSRMLQLQTGKPLAAADLPTGDGIVFADWIEGGDVKSATLIPATDVKTLRTLIQSASERFPPMQ